MSQLPCDQAISDAARPAGPHHHLGPGQGDGQPRPLHHRHRHPGLLLRPAQHPGSAAPTRTPTGCCASTCPKAPTCHVHTAARPRRHRPQPQRTATQDPRIHDTLRKTHRAPCAHHLKPTRRTSADGGHREGCTCDALMHCRISHTDQGGACGAAGPASAPGSAFGEARPAHAGPHPRGHADQDGSYVIRSPVQRGAASSPSFSSSRPPRLGRSLRSRRMRSASPNLDTASAHKDWGACEESQHRRAR